MTKATRSLIASKKGIERARKALIDLGITQTVLEKRTDLSKSTIGNFFKGVQIDHTNFTKICKTLNLEWEEIVEKDNPMKLDNCQIENNLDVDPNSPRLAAFVIEGSFPIDDLTRAKIQALVKQLQKITGDASLEIVDIQEGSIKIILKGTPEALATIQELYDSGQLNELVRRVNLSKANLSKANLRAADLRASDLGEADLSRANLIFANLSEANLCRANLSKANLCKTNLSEANLSEANLTFANLSGAYLRKANLSEAYLRRANLSGANFSGANLSGASFTFANFKYANLSEANLSKANLTCANVSGANLSGVDLSGADLTFANLSLADLIGTNLSGANLTFANLTFANLSGSDLRGANFNYTNVKNARFDNNLGISEVLKLDLINRGAIFDDSRGNRARVLPIPSPVKR